MAESLTGKKIALAASRKTEEMIALVEKQGGKASVRSLQGTVFLAKNEVGAALDRCLQQSIDWVMLTTGIGTETLLDIADSTGKKEELIKLLQQAKVAARGYKTFHALKKSRNSAKCSC